MSLKQGSTLGVMELITLKRKFHRCEVVTGGEQPPMDDTFLLRFMMLELT